MSADRLTPLGVSSCFAAVLAASVLGACGSSSSNGAGSSARSATLASTSSTAAVSSGGARHAGCRSTSAPVPKGAQQVPRPTSRLSPVRRYVVSLATNCGAIDIELDVKRAPKTAASFAYLVKRGFYDGLTFHRVAAGFVIQGGDPNGDGSGGPGYTVVERPPSNLRYTRGTVAMAKTGAEPAGASGSQFFVVTGREAPLPPQYALVGKVVGGLAAVDAIAALPTSAPQDGAPTSPVVIDRASLSAG